MEDYENYQHWQTPKESFINGQQELLEDIEGKHLEEPDSTALTIASSLSAIEIGVAFFLLQGAGFLVATIAALFPVTLLWAMAYYFAEKVELPQQADELIEQYEKFYESRNAGN